MFCLLSNSIEASYGPNVVTNNEGLMIDTKVAQGLNTTFVVHGLSNSVQLYQVFNLFSFYGNVRRCKKIIQGSKILVEFMSPEEAQNAYQYLKGLLFHRLIRLHSLKGMTLFGSKMKISYSRIGPISMISETFNENEQDYANKKMFRYPQGINSNRVKFICAPTEYLHLMVTDWKPIDQKAIMELFKPFGDIVKLVPESKPGMAVLCFANALSAINALASLHDYVFPDGAKLVVSFTQKHSIQHLL